MFMAEKELAIKIAEVDRVKINDVNLAKTGEDKVFQQFTANPTSSDHQYTRLRSRGQLLDCVYKVANKPA